MLITLDMAFFVVPRVTMGAWEQVVTVLVTVVLAVLAGTLYNNRRIDDVHRRIDGLRADMNTRFAELREDLREIRTLLQEALKAKAP